MDNFCYNYRLQTLSQWPLITTSNIITCFDSNTKKQIFPLVCKPSPFDTLCIIHLILYVHTCSMMKYLTQLLETWRSLTTHLTHKGRRLFQGGVSLRKLTHKLNHIMHGLHVCCILTLRPFSLHPCERKHCFKHPCKLCATTYTPFYVALDMHTCSSIAWTYACVLCTVICIIFFFSAKLTFYWQNT